MEDKLSYLYIESMIHTHNINFNWQKTYVIWQLLIDGNLNYLRIFYFILIHN